MAVEFLWALANAEKPRNQATFRENLRDEKSLVYLPRQYLPQPYGGICDEGLSGKGRDFRTV